MQRLILTHIALICTIAMWAFDPEWWPVGYTDTIAGKDTLCYQATMEAVASSGKYAPYWLQTNRWGDISASPYSGNLSAGIIKPAAHDHRWWDWDAAVEITGRVQSHLPEGSPYPNSVVTGYMRQAYAHARIGCVDVTAGIKPQCYLTQDEQLSSGSLLISNNAHPLPRISIGIDRYTPIPGLYGYAEIKGGLTHAWFNDNQYVTHAKLHHAWAGVQIGGKWPVNVAYEFHHAAQWGGYSPVYGDLGNDWQAYKNTVLARAGGNMRNDQLNAQGNHLCAQQLSLTAKGKDWRVSAYWQNMSEDNIRFIGWGQNLTDGIWGVHAEQSVWPYISAVTYELVNTTSQSGPYHDRDGLCYAGNDQYYRNSVYQNGWNYMLRTIGTPLITSPLYNTDGTLYTLNSRVRAHHIGLRGDIYGWQWRGLVTYTRNWGNDNTNYDILSHNTAWLVEVHKHIEKAWGLDFGLSIGGDIGSQWGNDFGALIQIRKTGIITTWKN